MADARKINKAIKDETFRLPTSRDPIAWQYEIKKDVKQNVLDEKELRLNDIYWKLEHRGKLKTFLLRLLVAQNVVVFALVSLALWTNKMQELQLVFSTLVAATLGETASLVYIIAKWLFTDIQYKKEV
jgi:hypothetical protein